jgi:hypothetical protein
MPWLDPLLAHTILALVALFAAGAVEINLSRKERAS